MRHRLKLRIRGSWLVLTENIRTLEKFVAKFSHHLPVSYAFCHILVTLSKRMALRHWNVGDLSMFMRVHMPIYFPFIMPEN